MTDQIKKIEALKLDADEPEKVKALAIFLELDPEEVEDVYETAHGTFEDGGSEYSVLTEEEADETVAEDIEQSLWAFNASFIVDNTELPSEAEEMIKGFQEAKCEGANDTIRAMIVDMEAFVEAAVAADGRGHFISGYDGEENEATVGETTYYIYRVN